MRFSALKNLTAAGRLVVVVVEEKKKTIPLPGGAELVKLAMSTNTGSVQPTGLCNCLMATVMEVDK